MFKCLVDNLFDEVNKHSIGFRSHYIAYCFFDGFCDAVIGAYWILEDGDVEKCEKKDREMFALEPRNLIHLFEVLLAIDFWKVVLVNLKESCILFGDAY